MRIYFRSGVLGLCLTLGCALTVLMCAVPEAKSNPTYLEAFRTRYSGVTTIIDDTSAIFNGTECFMCHNRNAFLGDWNCYRKDIILRLRAGRTIDEALIDVEHMDSDGDGVDNLAELTRPRAGEPGKIGYNPGLIGARGTDPCITLVINNVVYSTLPVTSRQETPPPVIATGPCCWGAVCQVLTPGACAGPNRAFAGLGGACNVSGNQLSPCCAADYTHDGSRTIDDVFVYLNDFFVASPSATVGGDGIAPPTIDDVFVFINVWFAGC